MLYSKLTEWYEAVFEKAAELVIKSMFEEISEKKDIYAHLYEGDFEGVQEGLIGIAMQHLQTALKDESIKLREVVESEPYSLQISLYPTKDIPDVSSNYKAYWQERFTQLLSEAMPQLRERLKGLRASLSIMRANELFKRSPLYISTIPKLGTHNALVHPLFIWEENFFAERGEMLTDYIRNMVSEHFKRLLALRDALQRNFPENSSLSKKLVEAAKKAYDQLRRKLKISEDPLDFLIRNEDLCGDWSNTFLTAVLQEKAADCRENCSLVMQRLTKLVSRFLQLSYSRAFERDFADLFEWLCCLSGIFEVWVVRELALQKIPIIPDIGLKPKERPEEYRQFDFLIPLTDGAILGDVTATRELNDEFRKKSQDFKSFRQSLGTELKLYYVVVGIEPQDSCEPSLTMREDTILIRLEPRRAYNIVERLLYALSTHVEQSPAA